MAEYILLRKVQTPTEANTVDGVASGTVGVSGAVNVAAGGLEVGVWSEVQLGTGNLTNARRVMTPTVGMYPNASGISFFIGGVLNRTDSTGPNESSVYHFFPTPTLVGGEQLRAEWTDVNGIFRQSIYNVPNPAPISPTASGTISVAGSVFLPGQGTITHGSEAGPNTTGLIAAGYVYNGGADTYTHPVDGTLTPSGSITSSAPGQVIDGFDVNGTIVVQHDNVTIRNCRVKYGGTGYGIQLGTFTTPAQNCIVEYCNVQTTQQTPSVPNGPKGILTISSGHIVRYNNVKWFRTNIFVVPGSSNVIIEDNYTWQVEYYPGDHTAGISVNTYGGGAVSNITVRRNWMESGTSSAFSAYDQSPITGLYVSDNYLRQYFPSNYLAYFGASHNGGVANSNIHVTGNIFERTPSAPNGGSTAAYSSFNSSNPGAKFGGNTWYDPTGTIQSNGDPVGPNLNYP